jgi:hypothetical protein
MPFSAFIALAVDEIPIRSWEGRCMGIHSILSTCLKTGPSIFPDGAQGTLTEGSSPCNFPGDVLNKVGTSASCWIVTRDSAPFQERTLRLFRTSITVQTSIHPVATRYLTYHETQVHTSIRVSEVSPIEPMSGLGLFTRPRLPSHQYFTCRDAEGSKPTR